MLACRAQRGGYFFSAAPTTSSYVYGASSSAASSRETSPRHPRSLLDAMSCEASALGTWPGRAHALASTSSCFSRDCSPVRAGSHMPMQPAEESLMRRAAVDAIASQTIMDTSTPPRHVRNRSAAATTITEHHGSGSPTSSSTATSPARAPTLTKSRARSDTARKASQNKSDRHARSSKR